MDHSVRNFNISGVKRCCSGSQCHSEACVADVKQLYFLHRLPCSCLLPCYEAVYKKTLTHRAWPPARRKYPNRTLAKLIIYLDGEKIEKRQRYAQFPLSSLVTTIGGTMGIYLGLSFVTLFSVVDTVATALAGTVASLKAMKAAASGREC
ncbi:uncharacterized protein LOC125941502 [Dermacentor silvarum]|uniref:uncharacterized protein LOC125941502 n=1 Tax=Dermacentor silvarum TaxID=543639 RepID=UPI0021010E00|nr:uncharacterized protein LOC125941502 [Dermacentor silvarum]